MLEEALRDPNKHPAEVATAMLSFIRSDLVNGGSSSEERFYQLFLPLCTRVFGEMMQDNKSGYKHQTDGWLSAEQRWKTPSLGSTMQPQLSYGPPRSVKRSPLSTIDQDPVVQLLGPVPRSSSRVGNKENENYPAISLVDTISEGMATRQTGYFGFPFFALPQPMQQQFFAVLERLLIGITPNPHMPLSMGHPADPVAQQIIVSNNSMRLFGSLLRVPPDQQQKIVAYQQKKLKARDQSQPLQLSPGLASPHSVGAMSPSAGAGARTPQKDDAPSIYLSMLEYYCFLFLRYPLAAPQMNRQVQTQAQIGPYHMRGMVTRNSPPYGEQVYCSLFQRYMRYFLPQTRAPTVSPGFSTEQAKSEFFLRSIIAFWFESHGSLLTTNKATQVILERSQRTGIHQTPSMDLNMAYDLTAGKFEQIPKLSQKCLRSLVVHLITDPTIRLSVFDQGSIARGWCVSQPMTVVQESFYNYVRTTFRHASIHHSGSVFYTALNAWLIWIEPWNVNVPKGQNASARITGTFGRTSAQKSSSPLMCPTAERKSVYTNDWKPYLAANLFLYTVPLAIFLRRARELDFSQRELARSRTLVKRVFRVFTPDVISALNELTGYTNLPNPTVHALGQMVANHQQNLGEYAPTKSGDLLLSTCQADMQSLLEEIHMQHLKTVQNLGALDKFEAFLQGLLGQGVVSGDEIAIQSLVERAKVIVGLPIDYEVTSSDSSKAGTAASATGGGVSKSTALRDAQGYLTAEGRKQLIAGNLKLSPSDVHFVGDRMRARRTSHEIPILVPVTIAISDWLNNKLGRDKADGFRINLRFFADYRNLLFISFMFFGLRVAMSIFA
ncbi:expressed unknown protein [Seminavis robusta]|uniref:Uncharacterized protein n=1 Tax=Seminavis robusta TaxID=568900 RepID=A0A9N8E8S6_9STRA|nr:expressed unknown protein [Seminavis robusta]|eukprot:Sro810_g205690.1 n/a (836) ;mRNA; f:5080-7746